MKVYFIFMVLGVVRCGEENDMELVLVHALWRHGERAALTDLFPIYEKDWIFGGGGFGELTANGMGQMFELGQTLRNKYSNFISNRYDSKEIYVRSTDINRTMISAMSVMYGFYSQNDEKKAGIDYPDIPGWNKGFNFIPIHVDSSTDNYLTNGRPPCPRYNQLIEMIKNLQEYKEWVKNSTVFTNYFYSIYNLSSTSEYSTAAFDSLKCQSTSFNKTLYDKCSWYNQQFFEQSQATFGPYKGFVQGYFKKPAISNGIDIEKEIKILQGGPLLADVYERMKNKIDCITSTKCQGFMKNIKFYAYSLHDQNIYSQLVNLGLADLTDSLDYWPSYSATILYETYRSKSKNTFFKVWFRKSYNSELVDTTNKIKGCENTTYCPISILTNLVEIYSPKPDIKTLCYRDLKSFSLSILNYFPAIIVLVIFVSGFSF